MPTIIAKRAKKVKTVSLADRYEDLNSKEKHAFFTYVYDAIGVKSHKTVYRWISGETIPGLLEQKAIAKYFKVTVPEIFKPL